MTRDDYAKLGTPELKRRLRNAESRANRADTDRAYLADMYAVQEIEAVLLGRGVYVPEFEEADSRDMAHDAGFSL